MGGNGDGSVAPAPGRPEDDDALVRWLYVACRNRALDVLRKEGRVTPLDPPEMDRFASPQATPAAVVERSQAVGQILVMLATLPPRQQEVVRLKFQAGRSYREISRITGLSENHVGVLIHTALGTIRKRMRP